MRDVGPADDDTAEIECEIEVKAAGTCRIGECNRTHQKLDQAVARPSR
jgi:hypothetical protein